MTQAVRWDRGTPMDLGFSGPALALNDRGQIAFGGGHAVLWEDGTIKDLGPLGARIVKPMQLMTRAKSSELAPPRDNWQMHAFLWQNGVMTDLGTLGGAESYAWDITTSDRSSVRRIRPNGSRVLWENGVMTDLGTLGGVDSQAFGINDAGQIVGSSSLANRLYAVLWRAARFATLGASPADESGAEDITKRASDWGEQSAATGIQARSPVERGPESHPDVAVTFGVREPRSRMSALRYDSATGSEPRNPTRDVRRATFASSVLVGTV